MNSHTKIDVTRSPFEQLVKVLVMEVLAAELQLKLAILVLIVKLMMIFEPLLHPFVLFVKFEKKLR